MSVNVSPLPEPNTKEAEELIVYYKTCPDPEIDRLAKAYKYKNRHNFINAMRRRLDARRGRPVVDVELEVGLSDIETQVLDIVQKGAVSPGEISRTVNPPLGVSAETVIQTIDSLREKSYEVNLDEVSRQVFIPQEPSKDFKPTEFKYFKKFYRIGLVSDTHMCSKYQQVTLLHDAYADFNKRQVDFVLHAGDLVDGRDVYGGQREETFRYGADEQKDYVVKNYPKLERNRRTYIIGGSHDRCFFRDKGYNILRAICQERKDLVYRGFGKAEFIVKGLRVGLQHPSGGVSYARSYRMQKTIENMMGFIHSIPSAEAPILQLFGHWHIPCHLPSYMGIDAVSLPCFQSQTPYLEGKGLMPAVGYAIAEIYLDKDNSLSSTKIEFIIQNAQIKEKDY